MAKNLKVELPEDAAVSYDDKYHLSLAGVSAATLLMLAQAGYKALVATASGNAGEKTLEAATEGQRKALADRIGYQGDIADAKALSAAAIPALRSQRAAAIASGETSFAVERGSGQSVEGIMRTLAKKMVETGYKMTYGDLPKSNQKGKTHPEILRLTNECLELHKVALRKTAESELALLDSMKVQAQKAAA